MPTPSFVVVHIFSAVIYPNWVEVQEVSRVTSAECFIVDCGWCKQKKKVFLKITLFMQTKQKRTKEKSSLSRKDCSRIYSMNLRLPPPPCALKALFNRVYILVSVGVGDCWLDD